LESTALSQIWHAEQRVVHAVGEVGEGNSQRQFNDLLFRKMLAQSLKVLLTYSGGCARDLVGKVDGRLILFIEKIAAFVEDNRLDLFLGDADPLRRSGVGFGSIFARISD
jgi:hypothetical protein